MSVNGLHSSGFSNQYYSTNNGTNILLDQYGFDNYGNYNETGLKYDQYGFLKNGIHKSTKIPLDPGGFNRDGIHCDTGTKYNKRDIDRLGCPRYDAYDFDRETGKNRYTGSYYDRHDFRQNGTYKETGNYYDQNGFKRDGQHIDTSCYTDPHGFDRDGYYVGDMYNFFQDGVLKIKEKKLLDSRGFNRYGIHHVTGTMHDPDGFTRDKNHSESSSSSQSSPNLSLQHPELIEIQNDFNSILKKLNVTVEHQYASKIEVALNHLLVANENGTRGSYCQHPCASDVKKYLAVLVRPDTCEDKTVVELFAKISGQISKFDSTILATNMTIMLAEIEAMDGFYKQIRAVVNNIPEDRKRQLENAIETLKTNPHQIQNSTLMTIKNIVKFIFDFPTITLMQSKKIKDFRGGLQESLKVIESLFGSEKSFKDVDT